MKTYYYKEAGKVKHITLNPWEYAEKQKTIHLYETEKEAKKSK